MNLETAEVYWKLNLMSDVELSDVATELLLKGADTHSLRLLSGLDSSELREARRLFGQCLGELNRPMLSEREAVIRYALLVSEQIVEGKIDPYDGAKKIWNISERLDPRIHDFDPFIYAASEYEDRPEDRGHLASEIVKEAQRRIEEGRGCS